jgi:hypothetical protein
VRYCRWNQDYTIEWAMVAGGKGDDGVVSGVAGRHSPCSPRSITQNGPC